MKSNQPLITLPYLLFSLVFIIILEFILTQTYYFSSLSNYLGAGILIAFAGGLGVLAPTYSGGNNTFLKLTSKSQATLAMLSITILNILELLLLNPFLENKNSFIQFLGYIPMILTVYSVEFVFTRYKK